jgi:hypothetical protein
MELTGKRATARVGASGLLARRSSRTARADSLRILAALVGVAAVAAAVHAVVAVRLPAPWIVPDELIYSEIAKSLGSGSFPAIREESTLGYGVLYPLLIAPAWALFDDSARAHDAAKVINAVVLSLTAFPVFFLARRYVMRPAAFAVSVLSVLVPSMLYAGTLLTEVALYPAFALALLGIAAALRRPTARNQLLALAGIVLAVAAKPLAVVLVPAFVLAVLHLAVLDRLGGGRIGPRVRAHTTTFVTLVVGCVLVVGASAVRGNPDAVLGVYGVVLGNIDLSGALVWFVRHLAALDLYVAIVPFAATLMAVALSTGRRRNRELDEFAALTTWTIGGVLVALAAYSSKPFGGAEGYLPTEARLHERNMFMVVPLLLLGLAIVLERGRPVGGRVRVTSTAIAVCLPLLLPLSRLLENATFQNLALIPWAGGRLTDLWPLTFLPLAAVAALVSMALGGRSAMVCWALVGLAFGWTALAAQASMAGASERASAIGTGKDLRWIDRSLPEGSHVLALWVSPGPAGNRDRAQRGIWMSEFYNRTVGDVVEVGAPMLYALPHTRGSISGGTLRSSTGVAITARYVLAPCWVRVDGLVVAHERNVDAFVYRTPEGPIRLVKTSIVDPRCSPNATGPAR